MKIRILNADEIKTHSLQLCDLLKTGFRAPATVEILSWRYLENPLGEALIAVCEENGEIIGSYAALPTHVSMLGKDKKAALVTNLVTHPEHFGKGIFVSAMKMLCDELKMQKYSFAYVFPNYNSNKIFYTSLGWKDVYEIPTMQLEMSQNPDFSFLPHGNVEKIKICDVRWQASAPICVAKGNEYLEWRYQNHPTNKYTFIGDGKGGWAVFKPYEDEINIVELHADEPEAEKALLGYVLRFAAQNGFAKVSAWAALNTQTHYLLEKLNFRVTAPIRYFALRVFDENLSIDAQDYRNWSIFMGDDSIY